MRQIEGYKALDILATDYDVKINQIVNYLFYKYINLILANLNFVIDRIVL